MYRYDNRVVITLDAGGTNLVFGAMQANKFIVEPITMPSNADDLDKCLATMVEGFQAVIDKLEAKPVAISFAFPGPADYPNGIIGGYLPNFPRSAKAWRWGPSSNTNSAFRYSSTTTATCSPMAKHWAAPCPR